VNGQAYSGKYMRYGNRGLMTDSRIVKKRYIIEDKVDQDYSANFDWFFVSLAFQFLYTGDCKVRKALVGLLK
jgi:hypothetical protein